MGTKAKWVKGILTFYNGAVAHDSVVSTTAAGALTGYGVSVLAATANATYTLAIPDVGVKKQLVAHTTFTHTVRASSAVATGGFGVTGTTLHDIALSPTVALSPEGVSVELVGMSSILWEIISASTDTVVASTVCT